VIRQLAAAIMATPPMTPPTTAPMFDFSLVAVTEAEAVGVEETEVGVEVNEVLVGVVEATEVGLVEVEGAAMVDIGTGVVSGPPALIAAETLKVLPVTTSR